MKIGIDARLSNETGVGRYIRNLVWYLQKLDSKNDYVLFVTKGTRPEDLHLTSKKFKIVETDIHWHTVEEQLVFYKVIEKEMLDLVHFPYFSVPILYTRPFVITIHDLIINHFSTGKASTLPLPLYFLKRLGYQYIMKEAARKAKKILTVSEATKSEIVNHLKVPADKIVVTYEGVDTHMAMSSKQEEKHKGKYFLYVGNAYPHKNLDRLVDAFALVIKEKRDCKLFLVGKDDYFYTKLQEKILSRGLEDAIIFYNSVSDEELSCLYSGAIALITPSLMEGFGLPGLEAMHHSTLVIASDIPAYKEVYKDAVLYFDPLDVSSMHATILRVLEEKESFAKYKEKGLKVVQSFSWEKLAKETVRIYESSIGLRQSE